MLEAFDPTGHHRIFCALMRTRCSASFTVAFTVGILGLAVSGCQSTRQTIPPGAIPFKQGHAQAPVVAVMDLENQAGAFGQWNLSTGMADMLVTRLMETKKVVVLERKYLHDVMRELSLQQQDAFRPEGRVDTGRLKNARYLIRGSVTDFTEVAGGSGHVGFPFFGLFGGGNRAVVALHLRIYDVESGEILSSIKAGGSASATRAGAAGRYKDVQFGGQAFKRTPLGQATEEAMTKAIAELLNALPVDYWHPLVAGCDGQTVIVNGGENVELKPGDEFLVHARPQFVTDPATGNVIDTIIGKVEGRIQIQKVNPLASTAILLVGTAARGQVLEPVKLSRVRAQSE
jgi:curli biogenesis system outer membrane secretion channel CsgG